MINCVTQIRPTIKRLSILESRARKLQKIVHTQLYIWYICVRNAEDVFVWNFQLNFPTVFFLWNSSLQIKINKRFCMLHKVHNTHSIYPKFIQWRPPTWWLSFTFGWFSPFTWYFYSIFINFEFYSLHDINNYASLN